MPDLISVRATEKRFRALRHVPSNEGFDERGYGLWPDDSFTHRLVGEGALKLATPPEADTSSDEDDTSKKKAAPKAKAIEPAAAESLPIDSSETSAADKGA